MIAQTAELRLECTGCDRDDGDGITLREAEQTGWTAICAVDTPHPVEDEYRWCDHTGLCPECFISERE